jgi:uncharacterized protein DUF1566
MRRILAISLALNAALAAGLLHEGVRVHAEAASPGPVGNGDVNGDGKINIADAIYLIEAQFYGGPAPVPNECPQSAPCQSLPATGETLCYDAAGNVIDCASADYPGQDGVSPTGCPMAGRFVDNGDGTITDKCLSLIWQKATAPDRMNWQEALQYCHGLELGGHDDWRLPNIKELATLNDYTRYRPSTDPVFETVPDWYWSSTTLSDTTSYDVVFDFIGGAIGNKPKGASLPVRAVRGGF